MPQFDPFTSTIILPRWHDRIILQPAPLRSLVYGTELRLGDCCVWTGAKNHRGYGYVWIKDRMHRLHRITFMRFYERELSPDEIVDHLCKVRACFNPGHLEEVTALENHTRGDGPKTQFGAKGCELTEEDIEELTRL